MGGCAGERLNPGNGGAPERLDNSSVRIVLHVHSAERQVLTIRKNVDDCSDSAVQDLHCFLGIPVPTVGGEEVGT